MKLGSRNHISKTSFGVRVKASKSSGIFDDQDVSNISNTLTTSKKKINLPVGKLQEQKLSVNLPDVKEAAFTVHKVVLKSYRSEGQPRSTRSEFPSRAVFGNCRLFQYGGLYQSHKYANCQW